MMRKSTGAQLQLDIGIAGPARPAETVVPLACDKWLASSAMQKSIRRGDVGTAQRAVLTLHKADPRSVWRRLIIIAAEDIGIGSIDAVVETARLASDSKMRHQRGGDAAAICQVCRLLAEAPKDRSTDYLIVAAILLPAA